MRPGQSFESIEVANFYKYRPDYPDELFFKLYELSPQHRSALDLGCGTGKVARRMCEVFDSVTALDASASMLSVAQKLQDSKYKNTSWVCSLAEEAEFEDSSFDLVVAAASIHWMDHALLFPRLLDHVEDDHVFATVEGDGAYKPPWQSEWDEFLSKWIFELKGERYEPDQRDSTFAKMMGRHKEWLSMKGETSFEHEFSQSVDEFIFCQFSRDTFAPSKLGKRIDEFSAELRRIITPYADTSGVLRYRVQSSLEWGEIRQFD